MDNTPSTDWQERIAPDEAERFAGYASLFAGIQKRKSARQGQGRALHRKQLVAAHGSLQVLPDLPDFAQQGLFADTADYVVWVRLSNGGMDRASDSAPDIRGFSFKVFGVQGDSALGGPAQSQDFALINQEKFAFPGSAEFVDFVEAASKGNGNLLRYLVKRYGLLGGSRRLGRMLRTVARPFEGFATQEFFSAAPIACGPYAVRVRLVPAAANKGAGVDPAAKKDWGADFSRRLAKGPLAWSLQLQPYVSEGRTPIEDASVDWPTPYTTVAMLTLPQQDTASAEGKALLEKVEAGVLDPWQALAAHRPLGDVMRARKVVYFESQKGRGAA